MQILICWFRFHARGFENGFGLNDIPPDTIITKAAKTSIVLYHIRCDTPHKTPVAKVLMLGKLKQDYIIICREFSIHMGMERTCMLITGKATPSICLLPVFRVLWFGDISAVGTPRRFLRKSYAEKIVRPWLWPRVKIKLINTHWRIIGRHEIFIVCLSVLMDDIEWMSYCYDFLINNYMILAELQPTISLNL